MLLDGNESAMHSHVDVNELLEDLGDYEAWECSITTRSGVTMSQRDCKSAMFFFRRCLRLVIDDNGDITGPSQPPWGTSVLLALRKATNGQQTCLLVFLWDGRCGTAANRRESIGERLAAARSLWLTDPLLPRIQPEYYCRMEEPGWNHETRETKKLKTSFHGCPLCLLVSWFHPGSIPT